MCGCLQSVQEVQYSDEIAFGNELLKDIPQEQMQDRLHRHIVAIIWRRNGTVGRGSGLLISKNLILTSAHNFFLNRVQVDRKCFQIYISPCGTMSNPYEIQCVYTPPNYKTSPQAKSIEYDYALVKLQKKVDADDFICLKAFEESEMDNKNEMNIAIFGYQNGNYKSQSKSHIQQSVFQSGIIKKDCIDSIRVERSQVLHVVSTHNGQSGSPMIQIKEEALVVMGIHKGGATIKKGGVQKKLNTGRLITKELIQDLKNQANLIGGQMFPVYDKLNPLKLSKSESNKPNVKASQFFGKLEDQLQQQKMLNSRPEMVQNLSIEQLMKRGDELYNKSQFKRARQYYRKIIQLKPYNSKAYFNMGLTFEGESYFEGAILAHKRASKLDPKNQHAHYNLGYCYQKIKNNKQARSSYQSCLKINAKHQNANQSLAKLK